MDNHFFERPVLNSPYAYPGRHWELDDKGQPTQRVLETRRESRHITPIPKPKKQKTAASQQEMVFDEGKGLSTEEQQYDPTPIINELRYYVDQWRSLPNSADWLVTPETTRLLEYWRHHQFSGVRPFFCQVEAVETAIWLTEVAPAMGGKGKKFLDHLANANNDANPELMRLALKLATGAGKTTVMAMLIAWQTINAVRREQSKRFTRGFLIVAPGLTIKDRLRVLQPHDPDSYYAGRELVPGDMLEDLRRARIVITNYHAFKLRERMELSKGGRSLLQGRGEALNTLETEGQMLQRVMPELMGIKNILALNDEAHHCYREKPKKNGEDDLMGDERKEAEKNNEAARLWISGLETVNHKLGLTRVMDLSATPFFLRGSGYREGTLFPWTMSDFSLMDAIECGIVKLPRVPVADNIPGGEMPMFRNLWEHIRQSMPKKGRGKAKDLDPLDLPRQLQTALEALYGHYEKTFQLWREAGIRVPPCFIVVCNNTSITQNAGIIGEAVDLNLKHLNDLRHSTLLMHLTKRLLYTKWRDPGEEPRMHLYGQLKRITKQWLDECLVCKGGTYPAQLMYQQLADLACNRITAGITQSMMSERPVKIVPDSYNPTGSTIHVRFNTSKTSRWQTDPRRCHINWVILDSDWEAEFCRVAEAHPRVRAYVKNHNLGLEVPYRFGSETRKYLPDFIVLLDDGRDDPLHLIVEIKGYRREDAKEKKATMETYWVPGVNNNGQYGRWAFAEFTDVFQMELDFAAKVEAEFNKLIDVAAALPGT